MDTDKAIFMKILIVEDEPSLRELMQKTLAKERYVVETADTFYEASLKIADYSYDCILLDIMLPDGNGLKLLEMLKEQQKRESIIIISARDSIEDKVLGLEQGADDYLPKPFHSGRAQRPDQKRTETTAWRRFAFPPAGKPADRTGQFPGIRWRQGAGTSQERICILFYFANRPNHIIDKAVLAEAVWGDHVDQADSFHFVYAQVKKPATAAKESRCDNRDPLHLRLRI